MTRPAVSVIIPVFNGENYLRNAIESVLNQTFTDLELIIVDDGSTDSTADIVRSFGDRVTYIWQTNTGVAGAFNHGLRESTGKYVSWLSHDDAFRPQKLEKQVEALDRLNVPAVCYTDVQMIDSENQVVGELILPEHSRAEIVRHILTCRHIVLASYSVVYDRRCIEEVGIYSETLRCTQDVEMLLRLARRFPLIRVPGPLMQVREHSGRGIHGGSFALEVLRYYTDQLRAIPLEHLFPELDGHGTRAARATARLWMAENFAMGAYPLYRLAFPLFFRTLPYYPRHSLRRIISLLRCYINDPNLRRFPLTTNSLC